MQVQHYRQRLLVPVAWLPQAFSVSLYHTVFSREMIWITALQRCEWQHYLDCTRTTQLWCGDSIFLWISSSLLRWPCSFVGKTPVSRTILDEYSWIIIIYPIVDLANGISLMIWLTQLFWGLCTLLHLIRWRFWNNRTRKFPHHSSGIHKCTPPNVGCGARKVW